MFLLFKKVNSGAKLLNQNLNFTISHSKYTQTNFELDQTRYLILTCIVAQHLSYYIVYLYRLYDNHRLEERENECDQPLVSLFFPPLHTVQDGEECRGYYTEEAH